MMRGLRTRVAQAEMLWCLVGFAVLQAGLWLVIDRWRPDLRDPEFGTKQVLLREKMKQKPGHPLALVLGSSRVANGLCPDLLPSCTTPDGEAVVFNYGITGAGPLGQLLTLRRLLADGIRPRWVVIEVLPALLPLPYTTEKLVAIERQSWADLRTLWAYCAQPHRHAFAWLKSRVDPWYTYRFCMLSQYLSCWVPDRNQVRIWNVFDPGGWLRNPHRTTPEARKKYLLDAWVEHAAPLHNFRIAEAPDRALRELLTLCRQEKLSTALLLTPESHGFQSLYAPGAHARLAAYLQDLSRTFEVPVIDARSWVADALFSDGHHLLPEGARCFTRRFGRDGLIPLLEGRLHPLDSAHLAARGRGR
jgi:hypothetical protein